MLQIQQATLLTVFRCGSELRAELANIDTDNMYTTLSVSWTSFRQQPLYKYKLQPPHAACISLCALLVARRHARE